MKFIIGFIGKDPLHQPPTHRELFNGLNEMGEHLISTEQTMRVVISLRKKKLIVDMPALQEIVRHRNLVPTQAGLNLMKYKPKPA